MSKRIYLEDGDFHGTITEESPNHRYYIFPPDAQLTPDNAGGAYTRDFPSLGTGYLYVRSMPEREIEGRVIYRHLANVQGPLTLDQVEARILIG